MKDLKFTKQADGTRTTEVLQGTDVAYSAEIAKLYVKRYYWESQVYGRPQSSGYAPTLAAAKAAVRADWACIADAFQEV